jgi:beta-1,4-mannosyltransferase
LAIAATACVLRSTRLIIDWHNFGYSILALKLGKDHPFVHLSTRYEKLLARAASSHLTVTDAMRRFLCREFDIQVPVLTLHDRPAPQYQPLTETQKRLFLTSQALFAGRSDELLHQKTRLLVSSTSWTPDEDFSILLDALCIYSEKATSTHPQLPEIFTVITGKGPQRDYYIQRIIQLEKEGKLEMITIKTAWLSFEDYASLLGAADLGVSLHTSSSGVDLPMKVVDMFGAGLPVTGWCKFEAWPELVTENVNGRGFSNAAELAANLVELFDPNDTGLSRLKEGAAIESRRRWDHEWDPVAGTLLEFTQR